ncbi:hypothetical protein N7535_007037 [Penicillium sp. DV-2018c]|nr:hypothetical protein N7461_006870 [Penicillium sp. DV-2018c]KAJ5567731.1 hypothetical protein N7535_007037 [Penicillium sp. DV-2018c]
MVSVQNSSEPVKPEKIHGERKGTGELKSTTETQNSAQDDRASKRSNHAGKTGNKAYFRLRSAEIG